jgi:hypothetical protein
MATPGFTALSALRSGTTSLRSGTAPGSMLHVPWRSANRIVPQTYPPECYGAQGYSKADCYGVVEVCHDCCQRWYPGSGYVEVCGDGYVCGACFGF